MDLRINKSLLRVSEEQIQRVYEELNTNAKIVQGMCEDIHTWYSLQPHLPQPPPNMREIRKFLIINKLSVEKTKSKIDMRCLLRSLNPEFFKYSDMIESGLLDTVSKNVYWIPLPELTESLCRINVLKIVGEPEEFSLESHFKRSFIFGEYRLKTEFCLSDIYLLDLANMKWGHFTKINPIVVKKAEIVNKKAYGMRIASIHILNAPPFVDKLLNLLKRSLKPKLASRIKCHSTLDDLHKDISKDVLPLDYGGHQKSLSELNDEWHKEITNDIWKNIILKEEKLVSDESKRLNTTVDEEILGMQGSFRKLDFD